MIVPCPKCNRKFKIDNSLIPDEGRDLQCGSCNHIWFYKSNDDHIKVLELSEETTKKESEIDFFNYKAEKNIEPKKVVTKIKEEKKVKILKQENAITSSKEIDKKNDGGKFFSYLIVFIISFITLIILLDTLKTPLINVFPRLEIILFNLFETLQDIKLFIIDLI